MSPYDVIIRPLNTEKTNIQNKILNQFSFEVNSSSNRFQIKKSIEEIFNVKVDKVNTIQVKGKTKQRGRIIGKKRNWKKAIVKLMPGEHIDFFEGV